MSTVAYIRTSGLLSGSRIAAEDSHHRAKSLEVGQCAGDRGVLPMPLEVRQEYVLPAPPRCGARLDSAQVDPGAVEDFERLAQRTAAVCGRKDQTRLVVPGSRDVGFGDHDEARRVLGVVLNASDEHAQPIELGRQRTGDGGKGGVARGVTRGRSG